jgi:hypothetical protein
VTGGRTGAFCMVSSFLTLFEEHEKKADESKIDKPKKM